MLDKDILRFLKKQSDGSPKAFHNADTLSVQNKELERKLELLREDCERVQSTMGSEYAKAIESEMADLKDKLHRNQVAIPYLREVDACFRRIVTELHLNHIGDGSRELAKTRHDEQPYYAYDYDGSSVFETKSPRKNDEGYGCYVTLVIDHYWIYNGKIDIRLRAEYMCKSGYESKVELVTMDYSRTGERKMRGEDLIHSSHMYPGLFKNHKPYNFSEFKFLQDNIERLLNELCDEFDRIGGMVKE
jgi:hypothetical protein